MKTEKWVDANGTTVDAIKWVQNHSDSDKIDESELEQVFAAIYGRNPDDEDRELGLWSLCCAAC